MIPCYNSLLPFFLHVFYQLKKSVNQGGPAADLIFFYMLYILLVFIKLMIWFDLTHFQEN